MNSLELVNFFDAVKNRDLSTADHLARRLEPYLRHVVRLRLRGYRLRHLLDSMDVCQSVLGDFFQAVADGRIELKTPRQLRKLLLTMVLHKVVDAARRERRHLGHLPDEWEPAAALDTPSTQASQLELLERVRACLPDRDRELFDLRAAGLKWEAIAEQVNGNAHSLRMRLARALTRIKDRL